MSQTDGQGGATAGWYDDPAGSGGLRWWNGSSWSEHVQPAAQDAPATEHAPTAPHASAASHAPAAPHAPEAAHAPAASTHAPAYPAQPYGAPGTSAPGRVAPGTPVYGPFIWIITLLPLLNLLLLPLSLVGVEDSLRYQLDGGASYSMTGGLTGAALLAQTVSTLLGWVLYGAGVVLAYFDRKWLLARGFGQPFHWAYAFIPAPVYPIGRSVVVRRRSGRGIAPLWVTIGLLVLGLVIGLIVVVSVFSLVFGAMDSSGYGSFSS